MKKLIVIAIALISIQGIAQNRKGNRMSNYTPEEMTNLKVKRMTLNLDLNEKQQDDVYKIVLEQATSRKKIMEARQATTQKPTDEERLNMMNMRLDRQIAMKAKMKTILNDEQFVKWEEARALRSQRGKSMKKGGRGKR